MEQNNNNSYLLIKDFPKEYFFKYNKLAYKQYIHNLFRYNQDNRRNISEIKDFKNFNGIFNNIDYSPIKNRPNKNSFLYTNTFNNNKISNETPKKLKKIKVFGKVNINNIKNYSYKSRNISNLMTQNYTSLNKIINTFEENFLKDKLLVIRPLSKKILKTQKINKLTEYLNFLNNQLLIISLNIKI